MSGKSRFLTGKKNGSSDKPPFEATLEWIIRPSNFAKSSRGTTTVMNAEEPLPEIDSLLDGHEADISRRLGKSTMHSPPAERAVIGALLLDNDVYDSIADKLVRRLPPP